MSRLSDCLSLLFCDLLVEFHGEALAVLAAELFAGSQKLSDLVAVSAGTVLHKLEQLVEGCLGWRRCPGSYEIVLEAILDEAQDVTENPGGSRVPALARVVGARAEVK